MVPRRFRSRPDLRRVLAEARYLPRTLRLVRDAAGRWAVVWGLLLVCQGLLPALTLYLTKRVVDAAVGAITSGAGWSGARPVLMPVDLMGLVALLALLARAGVRWVQELQRGLLEDHIRGLIHAQSGAVRMEFYDFPEFHDHLHRAVTVERGDECFASTDMAARGHEVGEADLVLRPVADGA